LGLTEKTKFYQASTSELFGKVAEVPQNEETIFRPQSPYAVAKLYAYWITVNYRESYNMFACNGILFNHESPLRGIEFVTRKISDGVARIKLGVADKLSLGNLDAKRDWGFAGDYMRAVTDICLNAKHQCYVIASGELHSIREMLETAFTYVGIENFEKHIKVNSKHLRKIETPPIVGDSGLYKSEFGAKATLSFSQTIGRMVQYHLDYIRGDHYV
jgi:GDPmannose 4,6-dehydratase